MNATEIYETETKKIAQAIARMVTAAAAAHPGCYQISVTATTDAMKSEPARAFVSIRIIDALGIPQSQRWSHELERAPEVQP